MSQFYQEAETKILTYVLDNIATQGGWFSSKITF